MSLFKKVIIVGLATMALGSAAMGDPKTTTDCAVPSDVKVKPLEPAPGSQPAPQQGTTSGTAVQQPQPQPPQ